MARPLVVVLALAAATGATEKRAATESRPHVEPVSVEDARTHWQEGGFAEMTPPIRLPSRDGREHIRVWLRIPDGARLSVSLQSEHYTLSYPPGTVADRVDMADGMDPGSVLDVRGTRFEAEGEYFHVMKPLGHPEADLSGLEWPRGDEAAREAATTSMLNALAVVGGRSPGDDAIPELARFARLNDCAGCHAHDRPERRARATPESTSDDKLPNRATDAGGLYVVASVLDDEAPLETHRARDMNDGDAFVEVSCADGSHARLSRKPQGARHFVCGDGSVPVARYDMAAALAHADPHALAVCRSRGYLAAHMDAYGRAAFAGAIAQCEGSP